MTKKAPDMYMQKFECWWDKCDWPMERLERHRLVLFGLSLVHISRARFLSRSPSPFSCALVVSSTSASACLPAASCHCHWLPLLPTAGCQLPAARCCLLPGSGSGIGIEDRDAGYVLSTHPLATS
jgi:hypothetical protein